MNRVAVVTDSSADLGGLALGDDITVVPLTVSFGSEHYRDGVDLSPGEFYRKLQGTEEPPNTAQPPPAAFAEVYRRLLAAGSEGVISLHLSAALSGTFNSAALAAAQVDDQRIVAIDTRSVSLGLGLLALQAARDAKAGKPLAEIATRVRADIERVELYATVPSLTYLARGGRIGQLQSLLGNVLKIVPIITLRNGEVAEYSKVRTFARAIDRIVEIVSTRLTCAPHGRVAVLHSVAQELADSVAARLECMAKHGGIMRCWVGPTVGAHAGPGALGAVFVP